MRERYWIESAGTRIPLDAGSVLLGRSIDCDVVLRDERVSRHHALVRVVEGGVEVVTLGARSVHVNGAPREGAVRMQEGDRLEVAGHAFELRRTGSRAEPDTHWFVERSAGVLVRVSNARLVLGGGADDDLVVPEWTPGVVALEAVGERLVLEVLADGVSTDRPLVAGEMIDLSGGDRIACGGAWLRILALPGDPSKPTNSPVVDELVTSAVLAFLPRGGRLVLRVGARERKVYLAEKRAELVACLLRPPAPFAVGDLIPDEVLAERLWPKRLAGRTDINTLLWRIRKDFAEAGLDRVVFFDRTGGGLRVKLASNGSADVQSAPPPDD